MTESQAKSLDGRGPVFVYSRAQAIADGALVTADERIAGELFEVPVVYTASVFEDCIFISHSTPLAVQAVREASILAAVVSEALTTAENQDWIRFDVALDADVPPAELVAHLCSCDGSEPAIHVMFPEER